MKEPVIDIRKVKTYPIAQRKSKVRKGDFAAVCKKGGSFREFYDFLPDILVSRDFRALVRDILNSHRRKKPVILMMGAHVIKCGLSPLVIDLMRRGVVSAIALNGAGIIHDYEIALAGKTSEDVAEALTTGKFGMAKETSLYINEAIRRGAAEGLGLGYSVGRDIDKRKLINRDFSILYNGYKKQIPVTVHVAIGTDIIHQTSYCDGASTGKASLADFHRFIKEVAKLDNGGVVINIGSNVILPEVFLKAVSVARNLGYKVRGFTAANMDKQIHYRPTQNVLIRPTQGAAKAFNITGHHEIMLPLLARSIIEGLR